MTAPAGQAQPSSANLKGQLGWISYELSGGPYFNAIKIFVFAPYFASTVVGDEVRGQELWGYIDVLAGVLIAIASPFVGSFGDAYGARKPAIVVLTAITVLAMASLWFAMPGGAILPIVLLLALTALTAEMAFLYHNSLLGWVAPPERIGLISGMGYSAGYLSTICVFVPWLLFFGLPEVPALGLDPAFSQEVRIVAPVAALWFLLFALPFFAFTPDAPRTELSSRAAMKAGVRRLRELVSKASHYHNIVRYLFSRMIYYDGLVAIFTFSGIYAAGTFGWSEAQVGLYGLAIFTVLIFTGVIGGMVDDLIGSRLTILLGLLGTGTFLTFALSLDPDSLLFGARPIDPSEVANIPILSTAYSALGFVTLPEQLFITAGTLAGVFMGPTLASSRTMLARIAPIEMMSEFFGLYTLTGKATAFIAPGAIALMTRATQDQRGGFAIVFVFLIAGFLGMLTVKEERAVAHE